MPKFRVIALDSLNMSVEKEVFAMNYHQAIRRFKQDYPDSQVLEVETV